MDPSPSTVGCFAGIFKRTSRRKSTFPVKPKDKVEESRNIPSNNESSKLEGHRHNHYTPACNFSFGNEKDFWTDLDVLPSYSSTQLSEFSPEVKGTVDAVLDELSPALRQLSMKIHDDPEIMFEERHAHDHLTAFMEEHGFKVIRHYLGLETAWRAEFTHGKGGRVLGVNSEMDALSGIGHACGHNLIAVSGVGVAIAVKKALEAHNVPGTVVLLGTPAEEGGGGKVILLERGAYDGMNACLMCHPGPGLPHSTSVGTSNAMQTIELEYFGHSAHAGAAPWEGTNALDAAFLAYSGISVLRQQMKPDHRVHGIVLSGDWAPNVIPDYAKMRWGVRAPTYAELSIFMKRVVACFEAASIASNCRLHLTMDPPYFDLHQNNILGDAFADAIGNYGVTTSSLGTSASTDFGNVCYALPALHPVFAIPTEPDGGNHTPAFAAAAATEKAHEATVTVSKALALTGIRVLRDAEFSDKVRVEFDQWKSTVVAPAVGATTSIAFRSTAAASTSYAGA